MTVPATGASNDPANITNDDGTGLNNSSTVNGREGKIEIDLGDGTKLAVDPKEVQEWKNAFEKKRTNADAYFTKKSQELSAKEKAAMAKEQELTELIKQLKGQQVPVKKDNLLGYEGDDPEVLQALKVVEMAVEKFFESKVNPELKTVKEQLTAREQQEKAAVIRSEAEKILSQSSLDDWAKGMFVSAFAGKYDVDRIPLEDTYTHTGEVQPGLYSLFNNELKAYEKEFSNRGLKANKDYIDNKANASKKLGTDSKGTSGKESDEINWKELKGRDKRNMKMKLLSEVVGKHLGSK